MIQVARYSLGFLFLGAILLAPAALVAQEKSSSSASVTGCLQKGVESGGFYLTDESGKIYELQSKSSLGEHVGHQITVTGTAVHHSQAKETKLADSEKHEANGKTYEDMKVTGVAMVSTSCK
jgi:Protein of unknown function (DUF5818)